MKLKSSIVAATFIGAAFTGRAQSVNSTSYYGIESASQIVMPIGMSSEIIGVNMGSTSSDSVNGLNFLADTSESILSGHTYSGMGYTASAGPESSAGVDGALFTQSTINLGGAGYVNGDSFTGLSPNTDYAFEIFLSDNNAGRGTQLSYTMGTSTTSLYLVQDLGSVNVYEVNFNTGGASTFSWGLNSTADFHDAKPSGFALFTADAVPEPSTMVLSGLGGLALLAYRRRK
jgi:hypothetical protein